MKTTLLIISLTVLLFCSSTQLCAQEMEIWMCGTHDSLYNKGYDSKHFGYELTSNTWIEKYRTPGFWIPDENTPIKTILVNWIICLKDDGTGGWVDTPEFRAGVDSMFTYVNEWYSNSLPKNYELTCEPTIDYITDSRVRFELNDIIFIENTSFHRAFQWWTITPIFDYLEEYHPDYKVAMNHFFTMPDPQPSVWGYYNIDPTYKQSYVVTAHSMYWPFIIYDTNWSHCAHVGHVVHEYGHAVGLHHTYDGEVRCLTHYDFLDDVFGLCAEPTCSCSPPWNCNDDYVCYLTIDCFWQHQPGPYPMLSGPPNNRYISPKHGGRMHRALSLFDNIFVVNNMPMHQYVKEKTSFHIPLYVIEDETWDFKIKMYQDIFVGPGATLTITDEVRMPVGGRIIVDTTALLIVDGGIITSAHDLPWQGIEVWGNPNLSQIPPTNQGWVQVINGGIIENAVCGIRTSKTELQNGEFVDVYGYSGGIVQANEAVFRNNRTAVKFLEYSFDNLSYFQNCEFITNDELPDGSSPEYFINLEGVKNVGIRASTFSNTTDGDVNDPERGGGIFAVNADILVSSSCKYPGTLPIGEPCPEEYFFASEFSGLYHGVYGLGTGQNRKVKINQGVFNNNFRGLFISALHNSTVTRNTFDVYREQPVQNPESFGFRIEDADGYQIEENHFTGFVDNGVRYGVGLLIENSGSNPNMVYNNLFENLHLATLAVGMNRNQYNNEGLCYKCNDFVNNNFDIRVSGQRTEGIALHQGANLPGNNKAPAGNVFSSAPVNSNFFNGTVNEITYHRHEDPQEIKLSPLPYHGPLDVIHVLSTTYLKVDACPSNLDGSGSPIEEQQMMEAGQQADSTYTALALLVDEGDTDAMNMEVQSTTQATANDTYDQLVQTSPYLSDTVLKTTIAKEDVLTNPMIRDVMVANPQSAKSEVILDMLEAKSDPMPESMMANIYDGKLILGGREMLEAEAAHYSRERYRAFSNLFRLYYADTLDLDAYDNLLALLAAEAEPTARYKLAFLHLDNNEPALAGQTLANIPLAFNLDDNALDIHQAYIDLTDIWLQIMDNPVYFSAPDTGIINDLMALYNAGLGLPSVFARNILLASGLVEYEPIVSLTEPLKRDRFYRRDAYVQEEANLYLKLYPNPTSGTLTLEYKAVEGTKYAGLVFTDMQGISQRSESLSLTGGIKHLSVKDLKPGVYMVRLFLDNKQVAVQRLTIAY